MEPFKTTIDFTDEELKVLNDVLRQTKVTFTSEEALLMKLGRASNNLLDLTHKIAVLYEQRLVEVKKETNTEAAVVTEQ